MRELLGPAASAELARELEKKERGNLAWWNERYIIEGPPPPPSPDAVRVMQKWVESDRLRRSLAHRKEAA